MVPGCMPGWVSGCMLGCMPGCMSGRVPGLVSGCMRGRVMSFAPDFERGVSLPLAKGVNMSSLLYIFSTLQPQAKVYHFRGYPIPSLKFCGGGGRLLSIGQLPDDANAKAAAANAITLVRRCSAPVPQLAASSRWCSLLLGIGDLLGSFFPMVSCHGGASHKALRHSAPASNKPHSAEKSTPVWLAIWHIWAGFANSQHRDAAFATSNNICAHSFLLPRRAAAQT